MGVNLGALNITISDVTVGSYHACGKKPSGDVTCFGANNNVQLGQGDTTNRGDVPGQMASIAILPLPPYPGLVVKLSFEESGHHYSGSPPGAVGVRKL